MRPDDDLRRVAEAQARFEAALAGLTDDRARAPSTLPGWTIGHLLTHVARNADSHRRRAEAAVRGEFVEQYPGGVAGRTAEIVAGAERPAAELLADVHQSATAMATAWDGMPEAAWSVESRDASGVIRPLGALPGRRWQELEVHLVDLGLGPTHGDWSAEFVSVHLPLLRRGLPARLPAGGAAPAPGMFDERDELAWLYGRLQRDGLPELAGWG